MHCPLHRTLIVASLLSVFGHAAYSAELNPTLSDSNANTRGGTGALPSDVGTASTAFGAYALNTATGSDYNTGIGYGALYSNTTGYHNTASGSSALFFNTTGYYNTASGNVALYKNTTGHYNTASGMFALFFNTTGVGNVANGYQALYNNTVANYNVGLGYRALYTNTGYYNTAVGLNSLLKNTTGSNNIAVGVNAGSSLVTGGSNIYLGHVGVATESNTTRIGTAQTSAFMAGVNNATVVGAPVYVSSTGQLGRVSSSARFKQDITTLGTTSEALYQLRPVSFHYKQDPNGTLQYGLIAEEVAAVYPDLVTRDANGQIDGMRYDALIPLLLNELQSQHQKAVAQAEQSKVQADQIQAQAEQLTALKEENQRLQVALKSQNEQFKMALNAQSEHFQIRYAQLESAIEQLQSKTGPLMSVTASTTPQSFLDSPIATR